MSTSPKVSIIVPIYNVEKYLPRCLESILNQTLKEIEIILVDDESPDNCPAMCDEYARNDSRVIVVHKKNGGLGYARNSGLEFATGEFVAFLDSDDYVDLTMYEKLYSAAMEFSLDTVYCGLNRVDNELKIHAFPEVQQLEIFDSPGKIQHVMLDMIACVPEAAAERRFEMSVWHGIYLKELLNKYEIRFPSEREFISEDVIFHIDYLQKASKIAFLPDTLYYYCANYSSLTSVFKTDRFEKNKILSIEVTRKLNDAGIKDAEQRSDRLFIGYLRAMVFSLFNYNIESKVKRKMLSTISDDEYWKSVLKRYPYQKLPLKYQIVIYCIKNNFYYLLKLLAKIK